MALVAWTPSFRLLCLVAVQVQADKGSLGEPVELSSVSLHALLPCGRFPWPCAEGQLSWLSSGRTTGVGVCVEKQTNRIGSICKRDSATPPDSGTSPVAIFL